MKLGHLVVQIPSVMMRYPVSRHHRSLYEVRIVCIVNGDGPVSRERIISKIVEVDFLVSGHHLYRSLQGLCEEHYVADVGCFPQGWNVSSVEV